MILVDTSAWVEFLRDTDSPVCRRVDALLEADVATCDPVRMEVLAGARDERHLHDLRRLLARGTSILTMRRCTAAVAGTATRSASSWTA